ncbi:MAG TPA: DUF3515 family protein [Microbacterium sp.]|nr:DUF3515 family protein [Microbacterium sp.]
MPRRPAALAVACVLAAGALLAGCSSTVAVQPAEDANDPSCADVTVRLPSNVDGESRRWTDAQATGAWGDPASVILTCGVTPPGPTTLPCQSVNGVDWIIDDAEAPRYRVTTFGRTPAVEVYLDNDVVSSAAVLDTLSQVVSVLPSDGSECTDAAPS